MAFLGKSLAFLGKTEFSLKIAGLLVCFLVQQGIKVGSSSLLEFFPNDEMVFPFTEAPLDDLIGLLNLLKV